ncbi:Hypothetical predicted protein [Octopus vulgaris]|uniref:Peptidoglycan binding-like domain-containing protein n=1 Tax=Octopus vulgaris TaxID=6645 RepID=A0AA36AQ25_OCTVU|nr:Hypothetical predicted protein [Octopus vulgaris]
MELITIAGQLYVSLIILLFGLFTTDALVRKVISTNEDGLDYLSQFGYLTPQSPETGNLRTDKSMEDAIRQFQRMAGITVTGVMVVVVTAAGSAGCCCGSGSDGGNANSLAKAGGGGSDGDEAKNQIIEY